MAGRKTLLTLEVEARIVDAIRQGAFDHVAAAAVGINPSTFYDWLKRGEAGDEPFAEFSKKVMEARAAARQDAENRVHQKEPFNWLRYGPGRERPGEPGWTSETTVNVKADKKEFSITWDGSTHDDDSGEAAEVAPGANEN
jgi:hypothetical protein